MPWNFPLWQAMRFAAPALMAGNVGLLKHASNVPQTALYLEELFRKAGFPADVFQTLLIGSGAIERVLRDDRVAAATLTGSAPAGQSVAAIAGDALKKTVLELGGSDAFIVMPSANLEKAAEVAVTARCQNNGQSCIAAKRFFVHTDVAEEFTRLFAEKLAALTVGDPMDPDTKVGPLATESGRDDVERYVQDAVDKGATVVVGGERPDGSGWFYPPTLLTGITPEMDLYAEEVFGPVAALFTVGGLEEALEIANSHPYGLGGNLWSEDEGERALFVRDIASGMAFINGMVTSYPDLPFGGVKQSGYGRELTELGMREFMNAKTVWVGPPSQEQGDGDTAAAASE
jgi:succinate-semialdehyde dehydrogenase/glutarate-semialdehyde dehydrogenase